MTGLRFKGARIGRLAVHFGLVFVLLMTSAGVAMYFFTQSQLIADVDGSLARERHRILQPDPGQAGPPADLRQRIAALEASRAVTDKGHALFAPDGAQKFGRISLSLPPDGYSDVQFSDGRARGPQGARALVTPLGDGTRLVIVSHSEVVEDLHEVLLPISLALFATAILGGLLATYLLGYQIAARLQQTISAVDTIAQGNLEGRVPLKRLDGIFLDQAASFNRMLDRIASLIGTQRQFSRNLAHDLRTPLTRLRGILREGERAEQPEGFGRIFERAERECSSTIRIFDALLRLSEIEAGHHPTALGPVALDVLIDDVVETMEPVLADAGCQLRAGELAEVTISADSDLIVQLLVNSLENVALHTPAGTLATVSLSLNASDAIIRISDDGPGLPQDQVERVLRPFERGANSSATGSGLGLAIAQAIAHFHGGDLNLSNASPGLTVEVRLPAL